MYKAPQDKIVTSRLCPLPVTESRRVNLDEASTVEEDLGPHVTQGDKLGAVL